MTTKQTYWLETARNQAKAYLSPEHLPNAWSKEWGESNQGAVRHFIAQIDKALESGDSELGSRILGLYFDHKLQGAIMRLYD